MKLRRPVFLLLLLLPAVLIPLFAKSEAQIIQYALWMIAVWIPLITVLRMRSIGLSPGEILRSFIPFWGIKYRFRVMDRDKD